MSRLFHNWIEGVAEMKVRVMYIVRSGRSGYILLVKGLTDVDAGDAIWVSDNRAPWATMRDNH